MQLQAQSTHVARLIVRYIGATLIAEDAPAISSLWSYLERRDTRRVKRTYVSSAKLQTSTADFHF